MGHKWCNYWVHMEFLNDTTGKMSKSKGEFLTLSYLQEKGYDPLVYRMFCLQSHYRNPLIFSYETLENTKNAYYKLKNKIQSLQKKPNETIQKEQITSYQTQFIQSLENDLNTANALTILYDVVKSDLNDTSKLYLIEDFETILSLGFLENKIEITAEKKEYIEQAIQKRLEAKKNKDFTLADQIREELLEQGILIKDTKNGTEYEIRK